MKDSFRSNLHATRLENLLKSASNADTMLNGPLKALTNDILWKSFERYQFDHNLHVGAKYLGNQIGVKIKKWVEPASSNNFQSGTNDFVSLEQNITILKENLVKGSKKIQSMNNKELLDVVKTNHLHGIKYTLNYILNPIITPRRQVTTITPRPYKELTHSISTDHLV
jgi:hypothetical protein